MLSFLEGDGAILSRMLTGGFYFQSTTRFLILVFYSDDSSKTVACVA